MQEAVVYKTTGSWYTVKSGDKMISARLKGVHKIDENIKSTNPIAAGDRVLVEAIETPEGEDYMITEILPRDNYIVRNSPHNHRQRHIIAANLDQAVVMVTLKKPRTSTGFIDRFLITSEMYHIPTMIFYNKKDIYSDKDLEKYHEQSQVYESAGYPCYLLSAIDEVPKEIKQLFAEKLTLLSGHSGVGKSTLLNKLLPEDKIKTKEVSETTGKGMHTTTFAEAHDLITGGTIIDTPGIRELGISDLTPDELAGYYPEMRALLGQCAFNDCLHINEPKCAVQKEIDKSISTWRYQNYRSIIETLEQKNY